MANFVGKDIFCTFALKITLNIKVMETSDNTEKLDIKDYIAKGIQDYRWSDGFLIKELVQKGYDKDAAKQLISDVKKERRVSNKESIFKTHS